MADMSIASNNERRLAVSDRPPFAAKDDVRFERKPPDRNILDRDRIVDGLKQWGVVLVFVGIVICFSVLLPDTFLTSRNAINILNNSPALILFATGATLALILGEFDLSFQPAGFAGGYSDLAPQAHRMSVGGVEVLVQVRDAGGSGYRERGGGVVQLPGQGDLLRRDVVLGGDGVDHGVERLAIGATGDGARVPG